MELKEYIFDLIAQMDAEAMTVAPEYFGVPRKEITKWKRSKTLPFSAAETVFQNEFVNEPSAAAPDPAGPAPASLAAAGSEILAPALPRSTADGMSIPASAVRPSPGQPRVVQPQLAVERHPGIEIAQPGVVAAPGGAAVNVGLIIQAVLAAMGAAGAIQPDGAPSLITGSVEARVPQDRQSTIALPPGHGRGWNTRANKIRPAGQ